MRNRILFLLIILALVSTACSMSLNLPRETYGELVTYRVDEKAPKGETPAEVELQVGAAELTIQSGSEKLLEGEIRYNNSAWEPEIRRSETGLVITQPHFEDLDVLPAGDPRNEWDLKVGSSPMDLTVKAGAYKGEIEFSDYALTRFSVNDGASETRVKFETANLAEMEDLVYKTGASSVEIFGLANANFERMNFDCGAGSYTLDFSGDLERDAFVNIQSGVSNIEIIIPEGVPSQINVGGGLNNIDLEGTWTSSGNTYSTEGDGPEITINIDMGVGNVRLVNE